MKVQGQRRIAGLALGLLVSMSLAACGGDAATSTAVPAAVPTATTVAAAPTDTTASAAPTATAAMVAPTATTAPAAPTDTAMVAPTATTAPAAPTDTAMSAAPTATTATSGGTGGVPLSGDAGLLQQAVAGMRDLKSYHMDIASEVGGQKTQTGVDVDVANKGVKMTSTVGAYSSVVLVIGDKSWISADGGKTYTVSPTGASMGSAFDGFINMWKNSSMGGAGTPIPDIKAGTPATEQIDGTDTKHLTLDSKAFSGTTGGTVDMWVTTGAQPRIRQMKSAVTASGQAVTSTIKWSKFDEDLGIKAPAK